jgi:drug/metabolite transporter (DMT)-like permease
VKLKQWKYLFASGFLGSLIPAFLFPLAQTRIDSGITGVLNALTPLFTVMIGALFFKDRFTLRVVIGILIGLLGSVLLITANKGAIPFTINVYALLIILATLFYGFNVNILKYVLSDMKPLHITSISMFMIGPFAIIYLVASGSFAKMMHLDSHSIFPLFYIVVLGVFGTALALILFNKLVKVTNTVFSSSVTYLIPIVAVIWGIIDGEILLVQHFLGMLGIIFGVLIANRIKK